MVRWVALFGPVLALVAAVLASAWTRQENDVKYRVLQSDVKPIRVATSAEYPQLLSNQFCAQYEVFPKEGFDAYGFPRRTVDNCIMFEDDDFIIAKQQSLSPLGSMPILTVSQARSSASAPITIFLVGGPHDPIFTALDSHFSSFLRALAHKTGGAILVPAYYGTGHRSMYPQSDLDVAKVELVPWLTQLQRDNPNRRLSIVGFSSGSLLAFDIFKEQRLRTVLVSAPPVSIAELYRLRNVPFIYGSAVQRARRGGVVAFDLKDGRAAHAGIREAPLVDLFRAFFGRHYAERTWTRELAALSADDRACLRVVFGERDESIAKEVFFEEGLERLVQAVVVPGLKHGSETDAEAQALASAISDAPHCSGRRHTERRRR